MQPSLRGDKARNSDRVLSWVAHVDEDPIPQQQQEGLDMSVNERAGDVDNNNNNGDAVMKMQLADNRLIFRQINLDFREINLEDMPSRLVDMTLEMIAISNGQAVVSSGHRVSIEEMAKIHVAFQEITAIHYTTSTADDQKHKRKGRQPRPEKLVSILNDAHKCFYDRHDKPAWNIDVNHALLGLALRGDCWRMCDGPVNYMVCATDKPHASKLPDSAAYKMVDFCIFLRPEKYNAEDDDNGDYDDDFDELHEAFRTFAYTSPTRTVNHTDYAPLRLSLLGAAVEARAPHDSLPGALLQVGVWHASQWAFLRRSLFVRLWQEQRRRCEDGATARSGSGPGPGPDETLVRERVDAGLAGLAFLPALVVHGFNWYFVATTFRDGKSVLWTKQLIGTSETALGLYKIVCAIQYIGYWLRYTYLPWFRTSVLGQG